MRKGKLKSVDLHDTTKHSWAGPYRCTSQLWGMSYHIPSEYTGLTVILRVYGETKKQCLQRKARLAQVLAGALLEEVSR